MRPASPRAKGSRGSPVAPFSPSNIRAELDGKGIRVDCIEPGIIRTEFQDHVGVKGAINWLMGSKTQRECSRPMTLRRPSHLRVGLPRRVNLQQGPTE
jgi:short-subunit dehydrogenase